MNAQDSTDSRAKRHRTVAIPVAVSFPRMTISSTLVLVLLLCSAVAVAQQNKASESALRPKAKTGAEFPRERVNRMFESKAP